MSDNTRITIGKVKFSYANVWEAASINGGTEKYSVSIIVSKDDEKTLKQIEKAVAIAEKLAKEKGIKLTKASKRPLRDGDEERPDDPAYKNSMFFNASTTRKPVIVDRKTQPIIDKTEFYSGCIGYVSINFYAFDVNGNKGIAAGLGNLQKTNEGERLSGGASAEDDFQVFDDEDDEDDDLM